eukprot:5257429-Karenia_brevis.AAC.1
MRSGDKGEEVSINVPWSLVLSYEYEIRKAACQMVIDDGKTLAKALMDATKDAHTRDVYFVSPLALTPTHLKRTASEMIGTEVSAAAASSSAGGGGK